ncbi:tyrosine-type recombinase/integrase, partial [Planktothrix agardhii]|uniref:tyrosine-type recombinase/integrase n=1 Tax=Planktothrix agardhii TaxID=1160 RepID=UPI002B20FFC5
MLQVRKNAPLFCTLDYCTKGHRLGGCGIYHLVREFSKKAGISKPMSPHRIRHSSITAALDATGGDVRRVQKLSRHHDLNTLMIYDDFVLILINYVNFFLNWKWFTAKLLKVA